MKKQSKWVKWQEEVWNWHSTTPLNFAWAKKKRLIDAINKIAGKQIRVYFWISAQLPSPLVSYSHGSSHRHSLTCAHRPLLFCILRPAGIPVLAPPGTSYLLPPASWSHFNSMLAVHLFSTFAIFWWDKASYLTKMVWWVVLFLHDLAVAGRNLPKSGRLLLS